MNGFRTKKMLAAGLCLGLTAAGGCTCDDLYDPCWPQRYAAMSRHEVQAACAPAISNGHILDQTVWNYDFEVGTDVLTAGGRAHLDYLARRRPAPDPIVYLQTAFDVPYDPAAPDKFVATRGNLDSQRMLAVQKYLSAIAGPRAVPFKVEIHDPPVAGMPAVQMNVGMQQLDLSSQGVLKQVSSNKAGN